MRELELIQEFLRNAHKIEDNEGPAVLEEIHKDKVVEEDIARRREEAKDKAKTLEEIAEATKLHIETVKEEMRRNEDEFLHWYHPDERTRYALVEHGEKVEGWKPGLDF